jgi:biopolymer transport protein ExbD
MRDPSPIIVDAPTTIQDLHLDRSTYIIHIKKDSIVFEDSVSKTTLKSMNEFKVLIQNKSADILHGKLALEANDKDAYKRVDAVIAILKKNGIVQFNLITPLEDIPGVK